MIIFPVTPRGYLLSILIGIPIILIYFKYGKPIFDRLGTPGIILGFVIGLGVGALCAVTGRLIDEWIGHDKK